MQGYIARFSTPEKLLSEEAHNTFAAFVSKKTGVDYLKLGDSKKKTYEIRPGILNTLKATAHLFPELASLFDVKLEDGLEGLRQGLDLLVKTLSHEDYIIAYLPIKDEDDSESENELKEEENSQREDSNYSEEEVLYEDKSTTIEINEKTKHKQKPHHFEWSDDRNFKIFSWNI